MSLPYKVQAAFPDPCFSLSDPAIFKGLRIAANRPGAISYHPLQNFRVTERWTLPPCLNPH